MNELPMKLLASALTELRTDPSDEPRIRGVVSSLVDDLGKELSPGIRLKLRRGSLQDLMAITAKILPGCDYCNSLHPAETFSSRAEHSQCAQSVDMALSRGILARITRPSWVMPDSEQLGADAYFVCSKCGAIWTLIEPEQHCHGIWGRIA